MDGYTLFLGLHGGWRWMVLISGFVALLRASSALIRPRAWTAFDERASRFFVTAIDIQLLLGLILYVFFSPFPRVVYSAFHVAMKNQMIRFFGIEHETAMLLALIAVHAGRVHIRRANEAAAKHRALLVSALLFFALALWAIPWPWRAIGRPLLRSFW